VDFPQTGPYANPRSAAIECLRPGGPRQLQPGDLAPSDIAALKLMSWPWRKPANIDGVPCGREVRSFIPNGGKMARSADEDGQYCFAVAL
jgi:hypothetical protein